MNYRITRNRRRFLMNDYSDLRNEVSGDPAELEEFLADPYLVFSIDLMCKKAILIWAPI